MSLSDITFSDGTLILRGWTDKAVGLVFGRDTWQWDPRIDAWRCPASSYYQIRHALDRHSDGSTNDSVLQYGTVVFEQVSLPKLRPEQQAAVDAWTDRQNEQTVSESLKLTDHSHDQDSEGRCDRNRGVVVMPTGTGKTEVALTMMEKLRCSTLIVAPIRDLMYQWHRRILRGLGYDAGIIGDSLFNVKPVSVTTYDSACIHMPKLGNQFQFLIFDECHHLPSAMRQDAAKMSVAEYRLGLTATPERSDGRHLNLTELIGPIVYRLEIDQVRGKSLAEYDIVRIPIHLNDREQHLYDRLTKQVSTYVYERRRDDPTITWSKLSAESSHDLAAREVMSAFRQKQSIEDHADEKNRVLEDLFRLHAGQPIIVFAGCNSMAREVSRRFLIPCLLSHCGKRERLDYLEGLRDGVYPAIVANRVLDEGVDLPEVKIAIVIGGMGSTKQAKQRLGRILRRQGNQKATLYEVVCQDTNETLRSRKRRASDAYSRTRHRRL